MILQNLHTHTRLCDGRDTPEEIVLAALRLGMDSLGFSGHSPIVWSEETWDSMDVPAYRQEVLRLREKYAGQLSIFLGIEQDMESPPLDLPFDFIIRSVHHIRIDRQCFLVVDESPEVFATDIRECFGGDPYSYAKAYFQRVAEFSDGSGCQIVGHFDLLTKFNENGRFFDETDPRYRSAALEALDALTDRELIFEINTGAMARGYRTSPYPAPFLLRAIRERGGRVCLTSDCHDAQNLLYAFPQAAQLAKDCGFEESWVLTEKGFVPQPLSL